MPAIERDRQSIAVQVEAEWYAYQRRLDGELEGCTPVRALDARSRQYADKRNILDAFAGPSLGSIDAALIRKLMVFHGEGNFNMLDWLYRLWHASGPRLTAYRFFTETSFGWLDGGS
jgi:hypothetical protein